MRRLHCLSSIVFMVLFRNGVCASQCENGIITDSLMSKTYSKDECLTQSSGKHCFKPIEKGGGLCYLAQDEKITHSGKDCNFHLPIVYESRNITISEAYLNQTFSETLLMNGSFPESALKHCQNINCYLVVYEQTSDIAYFMVEPKELNLEDSFEASGKNYTMYFEPRCEPTKPRGRITVEDVCADVGPLPTDAELVAEDDLSTIEQGFDDVLKCKDRCVTLSCTDYTFLPQQNACKFWLGDDDSVARASSSQTCVLRPPDGMRVFASTLRYHNANEGLNLDPSGILSINENVDNCWDQCVKDPFCYTVAITEEYCYLFELGVTVTEGDGLEFWFLEDKKIGEDSFCNEGEIVDHLFPFKNDPSKCQSLGMCHRNLGTPETPNLACYIGKGGGRITTLTHEDGRTMDVVTRWDSSIYTETAFKSDFPIERSIGGDFDECLEICAELSCLVFGFESSNGEINACRFATTEPLTYVPESSSNTDIRLGLTLFFAKHTYEACEGMGTAPEQAVFALADDLSITEPGYSSVSSCADRCRVVTTCKYFMWLPKTDVCQYWANTYPDDNPPVCVVEPLTDRIFPKSIEERAGLIIDMDGVLAISYNVEDCWNNCAKHPLCVSAAITPDECYLIDDNQKAFVPPSPGVHGKRFVHLDQKLFANEDHCDLGVISDTTINFNDDRESCEKRGLCYRDFGTSDVPSPFCFNPAGASERENMDLGEGISAHAQWIGPQFANSLVESWYTIEASNGASSYYDCVDECIKISCFAVAFLFVNTASFKCRLASEPFTYAKDPDNSDTTRGSFSFIKYLNDVCIDVGSPPPNAEFVAEDDLSTIEQGFDDVLKCKDRCATLSCTDYTFLPQQNACKFWQGDDDSIARASSSQTCVLKPLDGMKAFAGFSRHVEAEEGFQLKPPTILSINENVDNCWDQCVRDSLCASIAIIEEYCYLVNFGQFDFVADGLEFTMVGQKQFGEDSLCNAGEIKDHLLPFKDDPLKCQSLGMCHKNLGTPETPNLACYTPQGPEYKETLTHEDGRTMNVVTKWESSIYTETAFKSDFPIERSVGGDLDECFEICAELSCLGFGYESKSGGIDACRFATTEPLTYVPESSSNTDIRLDLTMYFAKHTSLVNELCPVEESLPANWQYHFASYNSYEEAKDTTFEDCQELCDPGGQCNKAIIYRPETSSCLMFESADIFDSSSGSPSTNPNSKRGCIVEPANGGIFRPKAVFDVESRDIVSEEPREMIHFPFNPENPQERNRCWEYCSQMTWCKALHYFGSKCLFFDREENTIRDATANERQGPMTVMKGKQFADEDFCDRGGAIDETFFWYLWYDKEECDFYNLCHRDTKAGEKTLSLCYLRREIQPEPIRISPVCEAQPFFTSNPGSSKHCTEYNDDYTVRPEGSASYDACALICITDENCYGFVYFPTTQECKTMANDASIFDYSKRAAIQARNDDDDNADDDLECQIAWEVPFCEPCYQKLQMEQHITYKEELQCTHTMQESCSDVYKTIFKTQEVEECKESFVKNCHIEYEMVPTSEKVEICHSPLTRNCNEEGPETCSTEYETVCATTYHENEVTDDVVNCNTVKEEVCDSDNENCRMVPRQVCEVEQVTGKKLTPETDCHQESREVCGPEVCPIVPGDRICADEIKTFVREVPQEKCEISPKTVCNMIHKIVPKLEMNQECIEVPQENCQRVQVEAKKEMVPVIKHFCASVGSDSSEESTEMDDGSSSPDPSTSLRLATEEQTSHLAYQNSSLFDHFPFSARGSRRNSKSGR